MQTTLQRTACLCGKIEATSFGEKDGQELVRCLCGIIRRAELDVQDYTAQYMNGFYHNENIATVVGKTIEDRFDHDYDLAVDRLRRLEAVQPNVAYRDSRVLLDVGCGNGAFVKAAIDRGYDAYGIDLYLPNIASQRLPAGCLEVSELADCSFTRRSVDVLVLHDVIEHAVDPVLLLKQAASIVKRNGTVVIDTPDFDEIDLDNHHVKPLEHIWYCTPGRWQELFNQVGLTVHHVENPIDGKIVFYLKDDGRELAVTVRGPTGLGDVHWILLKMGALKKAESPCKLTLAIPGNGDPEMIGRSIGFLNLVPFIDHSRIEIGTPVIIDSGADIVSEPDYNWLANGHLERGNRIEEWNPQFEVDYHYPVNLPEEAEAWAEELHNQLGTIVVFYCSSKAWNHAVTGGNAWSIKDWAALTQKLSEARITPLLIGKHWDNDYSVEFLKQTQAPYLDLTGKTSEAQALALFKRASAVIGMCSGITILAVHMRAPSIVFWPEVGKGNMQAPMEFHRGFQDDWVDPKQVEEGQYVPLSLGTFGVDDVVQQLENWRVL